MAFFTLIGGAVATALFGGSVIAANLIAAGLSVAALLALSYLNRPKKRTYTAVQGDMQFGADTPAATVYGTSMVAGQRIEYFKLGAGNKRNIDVLVLADGWCDGLEAVIQFYGESHTLISQTPVGLETEYWKVDGFDDLIKIKFYDGDPTQVADAALILDTAALDNAWSSTDVVANHAYVIIDRTYDAEKFDKGRPQFQFVMRGLREYDPRMDSTFAGGSGTQRVDDPTTWVHTNNPAVHRLNYQLGLKGLISDRPIIGMGKSMGQLDTGSYVAAMNVCDTDRTVTAGTINIYECHLYVTASDDHSEILAEFDDAMAGYAMNRAGLSGVLVGAPQTPVLTITADDIRTDEGKQISYRKSAFDQYNILSGQFTSPASLYQPEPLTTVSVNADISADGRKRATRNDFLQITDPDIGQYLLNIRYRQNRKGGKATLPVSSKVGFKVDVGSWVTYNSLTWLVVGRNFDSRMRCALKLSETGSDIYSETGIDSGPVIIPAAPIVNPSLLSTVQGFTAQTGLVLGADSQQVPVLQFNWTVPNDPTITGVVIEYWVTGTPGTVFTTESSTPETGVHIVSNNIVDGVTYDAKATIRTIPDRLHTWTSTVTTATVTGDTYVAKANWSSAADVATLANSIADDIVGRINLTTDLLLTVQETNQTAAFLKARDTWDYVQNLANVVMELDIARFENDRVMRSASIRVDPDNGTVRIEALDAFETETGVNFSEVSADFDAVNALISLKATQADVDAQIAALAAGLVALLRYDFNSDAEGWTAENGTLSNLSASLELTGTGASAAVKKASLSIPAADNNIVAIRVKRTSGTGWVGTLEWDNGSGPFTISIAEPAGLDDGFVTIRTDVSSSADWTGTVTGIKYILGGSSDVFEIDYVEVGNSSLQDLALEEIRANITTLQVDLNAAEADILLRATTVSLDGESARIDQAEIDINSAEADILLRATTAVVTAIDTRLTAAELEISNTPNAQIILTVTDQRDLGSVVQQSAATDLAASVREYQSSVTRTVELSNAAFILGTSIEDEASARANAITILTSVLAATDATAVGQATAIDALETSVTNIDGEVAANANAVTILQANVSDHTTDIAARATITSLNTTNANVTTAQDTANTANTTANAAATTATAAQASVDDVSAEGLFQTEVAAGSSGTYSRMQLMTRLSTGYSHQIAGMFIDLNTDGLGGFDSSIIMQADKFQITDGSTNETPFLVSGGEVLYEGIIRLTSGAATLTMDGANGIVMDDGT